MKKNKKSVLHTLGERKIQRVYLMMAVLLLAFHLFALPVYASDGDPLESINNLSTFVFSAIRAIGLITLGFGIVQLGLSFKSHDPSQRANGLMALFGGLLITFAKNILDMVVG